VTASADARLAELKPGDVVRAECGAPGRPGLGGKIEKLQVGRAVTALGRGRHPAARRPLQEARPDGDPLFGPDRATARIGFARGKLVFDSVFTARDGARAPC